MSGRSIRFQPISFKEQVLLAWYCHALLRPLFSLCNVVLTFPSMFLFCLSFDLLQLQEGAGGVLKSGMLIGQGSGATLASDFAAGLYQIKALGFNAIKLPFSFPNLFGVPPASLQAACPLLSTADLIVGPCMVSGIASCHTTPLGKPIKFHESPIRLLLLSNGCSSNKAFAKLHATT
jgi:hypothetical protein